MPVKFHTKTLESVLDPVSQQVAQLVLIHEKAGSGRIVEDLTAPLQGVVGAVSNLSQIAKEMASTTTDQQLKNEMPMHLQEVEDATRLLNEASTDLKSDSGSDMGKSKLLSGARGLISGMSDLLVCADMSEVRKMVATCRRVLEYLTDVAKVVDQEADLVTFVQNLTPGLTSMVKVVEGRWPELTNDQHGLILKTELANVKHHTPVLISAIRAYASVAQRKGHGVDHAASGRDYVVGKMATSIEEVIRVLQLTTTFDEETNKQTEGDMYLRGLTEVFHQAQEALASGDMSQGTVDSVKTAIAEGRRVAAQASKAETRAMLLETCKELDGLLAEIAALQAAGKGDTRAARELAHRAAVKLQSLEQQIRHAMAEKVATDFVDVTGPVRALETAATADANDPNRQAVFEQRAKEFETHHRKLEDTAKMIANSGGCDPVTAAQVHKAVAQMKDLSPQVLNASRVVLNNPGDKLALEHFRTVKKEWSDNATELTRLVDSATDSLEFLKVSEAKVKADVEEAKALVKKEETEKAVATASNIARQANRVLQFAQQEAQNSDDQAYVNSLTGASEKLSKSIAPMVVEAKGVVSNPKDKAQQEKFCTAADQVAEHVSGIRTVVEDNWVPPRPPLPDFQEEEEEELPELPPPPPELLDPVPVELLEAEQILRGPLVDKKENPVTFAAMDAFHEADKWEEKDNNLVGLAKQMARKMAMMSKFMSGEGGEVHSKADLIKYAKEIAAGAGDMFKLARQIADDCMDRRLKTNLLQRLDRIPTISTQLKILATVKATTMGGDESADVEASEMLVGNAENLMNTVKDVIRAAEAACIRLRPGSAVASLIWRRKGGQARRASIGY